MGQDSTDKIYVIPHGFVTADPGRNRYVRRQGTSMDLPPRLNAEYGRDIADPRNGIDWIGVAKDLAIIGVGSMLAGVPATIPVAMGGAAYSGLEAFDELHSSDRKQRR